MMNELLKQSVKEQMAEVLLSHYVSNNGINHGQYRIEYKCGCGDKLEENGHSQDPWKANVTAVLALHQAEKLLELETSTEAKS